MELSFSEILADLVEKGIIDSSFDQVGVLSEHGNSRVGIISRNQEKTFVIKIHTPIHIGAEATFLLEYSDNPLTPQLLFVDPEGRYLLYSYIEGENSQGSLSKIEWLENLTKKYINLYKHYHNSEIWGYLDNPCDSYQDVLKSDINYWSQALEVLNKADQQLALRLSDEVGASFKVEKYLVHGDPSIRNSLFKENKLVAVIDPYPLIAPKIYDLLFAFCSNRQILDQQTLFQAVSYLDFWDKGEDILIKHLLINLYCRIGISIKHHVEGISDYLEAWSYWKHLLHNM